MYLVLIIASFAVHAPVTKSYTSFLKSPLLYPKPIEAFPCGSKSISNVFLPSLPNAAAKFMLVVVLPTPPFWLTNEIILCDDFTKADYENKKKAFIFENKKDELYEITEKMEIQGLDTSYKVNS